jgi:hypothetical protein
VAEDPRRPTRAKGGRVVDEVTTRERRHDERQELVADVRPARCPSEVKMLVRELLQAEVMGEGGRQEEPGVGHQAIVVKRGVEPVEAVR